MKIDLAEKHWLTFDFLYKKYNIITLKRIEKGRDGGNSFEKIISLFYKQFFLENIYN